jgi:hypothetical protein
MMVKKLEFKAIAKYLVVDDLVAKAIRKEFGDRADGLIEKIAAGGSPKCDATYLLDFLFETMATDARLYRRFTARHGSCGNYHIDIRGLGGVYFYCAPEFDSTGYFLSIDDAASDVWMGWADNIASAGRTYRAPFVNKTIRRARK